MPTQAPLEAFKACLRGELLQANDAGYETARKVYNGMIDRHPRLIVRSALRVVVPGERWITRRMPLAWPRPAVLSPPLALADSPWAGDSAI
jgi:hypothetical protein